MKKRSGFKMKGSPMQRNFGIGSPLNDEKVVKGGTTPTPTFDDKNRVMTKDELRDAKINPKPGTTYYINKKTGQMSTATKA